ncbi:MAG: oligosaccharide flippase family protein [Ruminococcus sp.]|nr:oligosaccharide flippase family protein [Ruminococcus sp.]
MEKSQRKTGMLLSYGSSLLLAAVNIFLTPFLIRSLGEVEYGIYQSMASFAGYLVLINFGTGTVMTRYVSLYLGKGDKKNERNYIAMCLIITAGLALIISAVSMVMYAFVDNIYASTITPQQMTRAKLLFLVVSLNVIVTLIAQAFQGIITAYEKFNFTGIWNMSRVLLKVLLLVSIFFLWKDSMVIALVDLALSSMYCVLCVGYCIKLGATPKLYKFDKKIFASSAMFSLAIMLQAVVNQVNSKVDITILGIMVSQESVAKYSVAMQVFSIFSTLSTAAIAIYLPKFTKLIASGATDGETITREMIAPSRIQTLVSGAIMFGFLVCGLDFIRVWMGNGFDLSWWIAIIILIPSFFMYTNGVVVSVLDAMQKRLVRSVVLACVAVANVFISIILVSIFGEIGAPIGTAISTTVGSVIIMNIYYKKVIGIKLFMLFKGIFKGILPSLLLASLAALPAVLLVPVGFMGLIVKGGIFVTVLVVCLLVFGFNKQEKSLVLKPLKRGKG